MLFRSGVLLEKVEHDLRQDEIELCPYSPCVVRHVSQNVAVCGILQETLPDELERLLGRKPWSGRLSEIQGQLYTTVRVTISSASASRAFMCCTQPIGSFALFGIGYSIESNLIFLSSVLSRFNSVSLNLPKI